MLMLLLTLALIGFLVYVVTTYIPMPPIFRTIIYVVAAILVVVYLMQALGVADLPIPRVHR